MRIRRPASACRIFTGSAAVVSAPEASRLLTDLTSLSSSNRQRVEFCTQSSSAQAREQAAGGSWDRSIPPVRVSLESITETCRARCMEVRISPSGKPSTLMFPASAKESVPLPYRLPPTSGPGPRSVISPPYTLPSISALPATAASPYTSPLIFTLPLRWIRAVPPERPAKEPLSKMSTGDPEAFPSVSLPPNTVMPPSVCTFLPTKSLCPLAYRPETESFSESSRRAIFSSRTSPSTPKLPPVRAKLSAGLSPGAQLVRVTAPLRGAMAAPQARSDRSTTILV